MNREQYLQTGVALCKELVKSNPIQKLVISHEGRKNSESIEKAWVSKLSDFVYDNKKVKVIVKEKDDRYWVDFALIYDGEFFPINFKSGEGKTADNISGLKYIKYLIFYCLNGNYDVTNINEKNLALNIVELLKGTAELDLHNRDYFCLSHCVVDNAIRVIPVGCIYEEDLVSNPKNLFQANFCTCRIKIRTNTKDMVSFIIKKFIEYQNKRAESYLIFKKAGFDEKSKIEL